MPIRIACPNCGKSVAAPERYAGRKAKCPGCHAELIVPAGAAAEQPPAVAAAAPVAAAPKAPPPVPPQPPASTFPDGATVWRKSDPPATQPGSAWARWGKAATIGAVCLALGFVLGREYLKWELRSAMSEAAAGFSAAFGRDNGQSRRAAVAIEAREASEAARKVTVLSAACDVEKSQFGASEVTIRLQVRNDGPTAISLLRFHGVLKSPNRAVPWCEADFSYAPAGGLESGETQSWELTPNRFDSDWVNASKAPAGATFAVTVTDVDGPGDG